LEEELFFFFQKDIYLLIKFIYKTAEFTNKKAKEKFNHSPWLK